MAAAAAGWIVFGAVFFVAFLFALVLVKILQNPLTSHPFSTIISIVSITCVFLCVLALPVDVYLVSSSVNTTTGLRVISDAAVLNRSNQMQLVYNILYCTLVGFTFFFIPFAYFYYEEEEEDATVGQKICGSLKYTIGFVIAFAILITIGLVLRPHGPKSGHANWINDLLDTHDKGQNAIFFIVACVMMLGIIGWIGYGAYGAAAFPLHMIRGRRGIELQKGDVNSELGVIRAKTASIRHKRSQTAKDRLELATLERKEKLLSTHASLLDRSEETWWHKLNKALKPFSIIIGTLLALLGLFLITSLTITTIDRTKNSKCGASCGWTLQKPTLPNPLDIILVKSHKVFPMDYIIFTLILIFFFCGALSGLMRIGVRFAIMLLYKVRVRKTKPQAMLLVAMILNFLILTLNMQVLTLAPQYATFGSQTYLAVPHNSTVSAQVARGAKSPTLLIAGALDHAEREHLPRSLRPAAPEHKISSHGTLADPYQDLYAPLPMVPGPRNPQPGAPLLAPGSAATKPSIVSRKHAASSSSSSSLTSMPSSASRHTTPSSLIPQRAGEESRETTDESREAPVSEVGDVLVSKTESNVKPCSRDIPQCTATRLSTLVSQVSVQMPFFGVVFFYQNWIFIGIYLIGFLYNAFKPKPEIDAEDSDSDYEILD